MQLGAHGRDPGDCHQGAIWVLMYGCFERLQLLLAGMDGFSFASKKNGIQVDVPRIFIKVWAAYFKEQ